MGAYINHKNQSSCKIDFEIMPNFEKIRSYNKKEDNENNGYEFFDSIGRPDMKERLNFKKPWTYWTMELYRPDNQGGGGLGMLASDTLEVAKKNQVPSFFITPFYTKESVQSINNFEQKIDYKNIEPEDRGYDYVGDVEIHTIINGQRIPTKLAIYKKQEGSSTIVFVTEKNIGLLYQDENNSDHRLYQEVVLGMGGVKALDFFDIDFDAEQQLNEAPTVFSAIARLDKEVCEKKSFKKALDDIKKHTVYTNHTLVQAVEAEFNLEQFERFVLPNLKSEDVRKWLRGIFVEKDGKLKLSVLAIELAGKINGVSKIHAQEASKVYKDFRGNPVEFEPITNGISLDRWGDSELLNLYRRNGVIDKFDLPKSDYQKMIDGIDNEKLEEIKKRCRIQLRDFLKLCRNQYGDGPEISEDAKIFNWKRRIAGYKRPGMIFTEPDKLAKILEENNAYFIMAGRVHPSDLPMQMDLKRILKIIDKNPILKKRVHFIENYNEDLARMLAQGSDVSINVPRVIDENRNRVSTEACGTSWMKDILGNTILISTADGGVADLEIDAVNHNKEYSVPFLEVSGRNYKEELNSLYKQMEKSMEVANNIEGKYKILKKQLKAFLPIISGSRMEKDYLNFGFTKD